LTRDGIVAAALTVLHQTGPGELSMRRVAQELDTGAASLYAHVRNRDELAELVFDRILGAVPLAEPDPRRWPQQLRQLLRDTAQVVGRAGLAPGRLPSTPNSRRYAEAMLALLRCGGVPDGPAALAVDLLSRYAMAAAVEETVDGFEFGLDVLIQGLVTLGQHVLT
jgi:AcrR family transcriptional regulator